MVNFIVDGGGGADSDKAEEALLGLGREAEGVRGRGEVVIFAGSVGGV